MVPKYDLLRNRRMDVVTINYISLFYLVKQIDSMLAWVCTVTDHSTSCAIFSFLSHFYVMCDLAEHTHCSVECVCLAGNLVLCSI